MKVQCKTGKDVASYCRGVQAFCPSRCPQSCTMDCKSKCKPICVCDKPGACGDPRFIGGDGNSFHFHGRKDRDFCIVSDSDLHINAHFIGKRSPTMTRDFTWIQAIAVLFGEHRLYIGARKTVTWDDESDHLEISFDGEYVHLPQGDDAEWKSLYVPTLKITRTKAVNTVMVELKGRFKIIANVVPITKEDSRIHNYGVTSDDCLAHLDLAFKFDVLTSNVQGVVGQTYRPDYVNRFDVRTKMPILGGESNYSTSGLFSTDCAVARFGHVGGAVKLISDLADVKCSSGMDGPGVVCKK
ncbi:root cap protein 2 [Carex littledalei]|uniref:Root cap protein 2 n=1 Tax=Carex littledalei TaxID=544730 RepID=A0A833RCT8_9POAL|nr:root cap protein 2 [Carex littledalei]